MAAQSVYKFFKFFQFFAQQLASDYVLSLANGTVLSARSLYPRRLICPNPKTRPIYSNFSPKP